MTKDELEKLVLTSKNPMTLAKAFAGLDEKQRKALSTHAQGLNKQLESNKLNKTASPKLVKHIKSRKGEVWSHWHKPDTVNSRLAVIAVGPLTAVKKMHFYWGDNLWDVINKIIVDRRPDWLDDWIEHDLAQEFASFDFKRIWEWMEKGLCQHPQHEGFYVRFAHYMMATGVYDKGPGMPITKALKAEPKFKEYVWSLFKVESNAFNTNSWFRKGAADDYESWTEALVKMANAGELDRQRLLDASLEGLWADLKQNQLSGFHKFHKALNPTPDDIANRQSNYLSLLSHAVGHVVKFGLDNASTLEKEKTLDVQMFLAEVPNVFFQDAKGNAMAAVKLLGRIIKSQPKQAAEVLALLPEALRHPHPDVQNLALGILEKNEKHITEEVRQNIADAADFVSASVRLQLAAYMPSDTPAATADDDAPETDVDISTLSKRRLKALRIAELQKPGSFEYWPISQNILDHDVLPHLDPIEPIESEDDLIGALSHAVEIVDTPDDIERIIDGISRLAGARSADFKAKTAPLLTRIEKKQESESNKGLRYHGNVSSAIMDLVYTWLTQKYRKLPQKKFEKHVTAFIPAAQYFHEVSARVSKGQARSLLTFPTHSGGWIDPLIWVERLKEFQASKIQLSESEVALSVLRLAPDHRAKALKAADDLTGDLGRLAKFALGGDERPKAQDKKQYGMWVSAARCRSPYDDHSELLSELKLKDNWPDGIKPAVFEWRAYTESKPSQFNDEVYHYPRLDISVSVKDKVSGFGQKKPGLLPRIKNPLTTEWERMPSAAPHCRTRQRYFWSSELNTVYLSKWLCYQWPQCPNAAFIIAVEDLIQRIDENSSSWEPNFGYLDGLFVKNRPWLEAGHLMLCVALAGKDADVRGLAIDALIEGIENGTFDVDVCVNVLTKLSESGWLKLNRLGDNLMTVTETSVLHAWVVSALIQGWIQRTDIKQRYMFRMLEVLLEAQSTLGQGLQPTSIDVLKTLKGLSKAAKIAKTLIKIEDLSQPSLDVQLRNQAIANRV